MRKPAFALAVILLSLPLAAQSQELPQPIQVAATILGLSEGQLHAWVSALEAREAAVRPLAEQIRARHEQLGRVVQSPSPDSATVGRFVLEIRALEQQMGAAARQATEILEQLLDDEQRGRLDFVRNAAGACEVVPAFRAAGLL